jgi:hypothetical protein
MNSEKCSFQLSSHSSPLAEPIDFGEFRCVIERAVDARGIFGECLVVGSVLCRRMELGDLLRRFSSW